MPNPTNFLWTPRSTRNYFRVWPHSPNTITYNGPPPPPSTKRTPISLADGNTGELLAQLKKWEDEIGSLEAQAAANPATLKDQLASLMFSSGGVSGQLRRQAVLMEGGGEELSKGEFRIMMRSLGIGKTVGPGEIDALFDEWDGNSSGTVDIREVELALEKLKQHWVESEGKAGAARIKRRQQLEVLRARVKNANEAMGVNEAAERGARALAEAEEHIASRIDIQLGGVLAKRAIKAGELVGTWQGARPLPNQARPDRRYGGGRSARVSDHRTELTKAEFVKGVLSLGLMVGPRKDESPPLAELHALFDQYDADHSGFLDLKEAAAALKAWEAEGKRLFADKAARTTELASLRMKAARKLQDALREPEPVQAHGLAAMLAAANGADGVGEAGASGRGRNTFRMPILSSRRKRQESAAPLEERAKEQARRAMHLLQHRELGKAWETWRSFVEQTDLNRESIGSVLLTIRGREVAVGFRTWCGWYAERVKLAGLLAAAATRIYHLEASRVWHVWAAIAKEARRATTPGLRAMMSDARGASEGGSRPRAAVGGGGEQQKADADSAVADLCRAMKCCISPARG